MMHPLDVFTTREVVNLLTSVASMTDDPLTPQELVLLSQWSKDLIERINSLT